MGTIFETRAQQSCGVQVIKLPADYVFFRVRSDGSIPEPDYLLPGYDFAKDEIKDRQAELKSGHTAVPDGSIPKPHTWKMSKGSRAGKSRQRYIDSTKKDREEAEKERYATGFCHLIRRVGLFSKFYMPTYSPFLCLG